MTVFFFSDSNSGRTFLQPLFFMRENTTTQTPDCDCTSPDFILQTARSKPTLSINTSLNSSANIASYLVWMGLSEKDQLTPFENGVVCKHLGRIRSENAGGEGPRGRERGRKRGRWMLLRTEAVHKTDNEDSKLKVLVGDLCITDWLW